MNKQEALYNFWNSFEIPAYEENTVPTGDNSLKFPYITYEMASDEFGNEIALGADLWYHSFSWKEINEKATEISQKIGRNGSVFRGVWIKKGSPFAQNLSEPSDDAIRRIHLNITAEFFSAN